MKLVSLLILTNEFENLANLADGFRTRKCEVLHGLK